MVTLKGKLVGAETIQQSMVFLGETVRQRLREAVAESAQALVSVAKGHVRRDTGTLAGSIGWQPNEVPWKRITARVGTEVIYGRFLESGWTPNPRKSAGWKRNPRKASQWKEYDKVHGGRRIIAYPFLKPSMNVLRNGIRARLEAAIEGTKI